MQRMRLFAWVLLACLVTMGCERKVAGPDEAAKPAEASPFVRSAAFGGSNGKVESAGAVEATGTVAESGVPKIEFALSEFDFGEVEAGTKVEHVFTFKNTGDALLKIEKVRSS